LAAQDLSVLAAKTAKDQAIRHLKSALDGYRQAGADRDQARIRRRLRQLGIRRHAPGPQAQHRLPRRAHPHRHRAGGEDGS
jgi:hypothetical protein